MSSSDGDVRPGGGLAVSGSGLHAVVEDPDQAVGELAESCIVPNLCGLAWRRRKDAPGELRSAPKSPGWTASPSLSFLAWRARTTGMVPKARVMGDVPA